MKRADAWFTTISNHAGRLCGHPLAFILSFVIVVVWAVSGPLFGFSDTWQLVINTGTTVVTYLLLFVVQNSQNRNAAATQLKLDEILRALPEARTELALERLEDAPEAALRTQRRTFESMATEHSPQNEPSGRGVMVGAADLNPADESHAGSTPAARTHE